jgi:hypothetical protein
MWASRRDGKYTVEIRLPRYDRPDRDPLHTAASGEIAAYALREFRDASAVNGRAGFPLRGSPARTFHRINGALARDRRHNKKIVDVTPELAPIDYPEIAHAIPECVADLAWARPIESLTAAELSAAWCGVHDGNAQYTRQMGAIRYGLGNVTHHAHPQFDPRRAGWWRVQYRVTDWPAELPAPGWPLPPGQDGWVVTETAAFLIEDGKAELEHIEEAWLWDRAERALDRLQERLSLARSRLLQREADETLTPVERAGAALARKILTTSYKSGIGQWSMVENRDKTERLFDHRPYFRHAIVAASTAGILRDVGRAWKKTGLCPVAIAVDCLAYLADRPDSLLDELGLKRGTALGAYKPVHAGKIPAELMREALTAIPRLSETTPTPLDIKAHNEALGAVLSLITGG